MATHPTEAHSVSITINDDALGPRFLITCSDGDFSAEADYPIAAIVGAYYHRDEVS